MLHKGGFILFESFETRVLNHWSVGHVLLTMTKRITSERGGIRFAPSPTGRFHLGNLRTAWISAWIAHELGRPWCCRFEDIDQPRVLVGAREGQLEDMAQLGLVPTRTELQSGFEERHRELFLRARESGKIYPCFCSRREVQEALQAASSAPHHAPALYNGRCRDLHQFPTVHNSGVAWRFLGEDSSGKQDFIIGRTKPPRLDSDDWVNSFVPAYHWACAIDDYDGKYALLVRAWDLAPAAEQQRAIHRWLCEVEGELPVPAVFHTSLVVGENGERLEKRTRGVTLPDILAASDLSKQEVLAKVLKSFEKSFADRKMIKTEPGALSGERRQSLRVSELI